MGVLGGVIGVIEVLVGPNGVLMGVLVSPNGVLGGLWGS